MFKRFLKSDFTLYKTNNPTLQMQILHSQKYQTIVNELVWMSSSPILKGNWWAIHADELTGRL